jgi:acetyl esterase/lipase
VAVPLLPRSGIASREKTRTKAHDRQCCHDPHRHGKLVSCEDRNDSHNAERNAADHGSDTYRRMNFLLSHCYSCRCSSSTTQACSIRRIAHPAFRKISWQEKKRRVRPGKQAQFTLSGARIKASLNVMSSWSDQDDVRPPPCPGCGLATPIFKVVVESGRRHYQWLTVVLTACLLTGCSPFPHLNTFSPSEQAQEPLDIAYSKIARQRLDVFEQVSAHTQAARVAIFYYGGAWDRGSRADYRFVGRTLAARGFVAIVPDCRVYPEVVFRGCIDDAAATTAWVLENAPRFNGDPAQVFLMGHSAWAQIAAMVALDDSYLDAHGYSPQQLTGWIRLSGPHDCLPLQSRRLKNIFREPAPRATPPIEFVSANAPPALLISGDADSTVVPRNTRRLAARLRASGVEVRKVIYPDVGHARTVVAFSTTADGLPAVDEVANFVISQTPRENRRAMATR